MDKPIQLLINELKQNLVTIINDTKIPMFCITPILKDIYEQCKIVEEEQYSTALKQYEESNKENAKEDKK